MSMSMTEQLNIASVVFTPEDFIFNNWPAINLETRKKLDEVLLSKKETTYVEFTSSFCKELKSTIVNSLEKIENSLMGKA